MMPTEVSNVDVSNESQLLILEMKDIAPFQSSTEEQRNLLSIFGTISNPKEFKEALSLKSSANDGIVEQCIESSDYDHRKEDESDNNIKLDQQFSSTNLQQFSLSQSIYPKKSLTELESCSLKELKLLWSDLSHIIKKVSSELVQLLLENDALQQESDARNVAIEQLLKMTVKNTEVELRQIQMSVILPDNEDSDGR